MHRVATSTAGRQEGTHGHVHVFAVDRCFTELVSKYEHCRSSVDRCVPNAGHRFAMQLKDVGFVDTALARMNRLAANSAVGQLISLIN